MKSIAIKPVSQISSWMVLLVLLMAPLASCSRPPSDASNPDTPTAAVDNQPDNGVQVGILVIRNIETTRAQYEPILNYLSKAVNRPFVLVPLAQESQFLEVEQNKVDFVISNPLAAVQMQRLYGTEFIATQSLPDTGPKLGGQIIVKSDSTINSVANLRGKKGGCVSLSTAAAGCLFQMLHVEENGLNPYLDFEGLTEIPSQNDIVLKVISGELEFGFIRTGQLETMIKTGLLTDASQVRVLEPRQDGGFVYEHTTRLYPTWAVAATGKPTPELVEAVKQALVAMPPDSPALEAAGIESFVPPVDYAAVDQLIEAMQLRSWDAQ
jgi:two-component system, LuxR family, sensor histidine kinase TtrS